MWLLIDFIKNGSRFNKENNLTILNLKNFEYNNNFKNNNNTITNNDNINNNLINNKNLKIKNLKFKIKETSIVKNLLKWSLIGLISISTITLLNKKFKYF